METLREQRQKNKNKKQKQHGSEGVGGKVRQEAVESKAFFFQEEEEKSGTTPEKEGMYATPTSLERTNVARSSYETCEATGLEPTSPLTTCVSPEIAKIVFQLTEAAAAAEEHVTSSAELTRTTFLRDKSRYQAETC